MADVKKNIGLIGLSAKGSWAAMAHMGYLANTPHYNITALQNSSKQSAQASAEKYNLQDAATHDSPEAIANDSNVDIVAVSVKVPQHYELIRPALEAGKDVFVEWPLARNLAEAEELAQLAKEKGVRTLVGLQARQDPSVIKAKEIVASGVLGKIVGSTMFGHGGIFAQVTTPNYTYLANIDNGANLVTIPFGHAVDALCFVLGEVKQISATLANHRPELHLVGDAGEVIERVPKTSHDHISMTAILIEGGGIVDVTYVAESSRTGRDFFWEIIGTEGTLVLEGKKGGHVQMFQPVLKRAVGKEEFKEVEVEKAPDFSYNVGKAWEAWAGVGLEKGNSVTTFEDALTRHRMIEAIYRSAERGSREDYL